jgi:hypothetical protein
MAGTIGDFVQKDGDGRKRKNKKWSVEEEEKLVKYYDLYPNNVPGLIHDYLIGRNAQQIYNKVNTLKHSGKWDVVLERIKVNKGSIKTVEKIEHVEVHESRCEKCVHKSVCHFTFSNLSVLNVDKHVVYGVIECEHFNQR